jgi:hypothetical protein
MSCGAIVIVFDGIAGVERVICALHVYGRQTAVAMCLLLGRSPGEAMMG